MSNETSKILYTRAEIDGNALGDEMVFFDGRAGKYFATGPVGADIWQILSSPSSLQAIVNQLRHIYEVDEDTCRAQTKEFVDHMVRIGLIRIEPDNRV